MILPSSVVEQKIVDFCETMVYGVLTINLMFR
jgi:hypothetical protein